MEVSLLTKFNMLQVQGNVRFGTVYVVGTYSFSKKST